MAIYVVLLKAVFLLNKDLVQKLLSGNLERDLTWYEIVILKVFAEKKQIAHSSEVSKKHSSKLSKEEAVLGAGVPLNGTCICTFGEWQKV